MMSLGWMPGACAGVPSRGRHDADVEQFVIFNLHADAHKPSLRVLLEAADLVGPDDHGKLVQLRHHAVAKLVQQGGVGILTESSFYTRVSRCTTTPRPEPDRAGRPWVDLAPGQVADFALILRQHRVSRLDFGLQTRHSASPLLSWKPSCRSLVVTIVWTSSSLLVSRPLTSFWSTCCRVLATARTIRVASHRRQLRLPVVAEGSCNPAAPLPRPPSGLIPRLLAAKARAHTACSIS